MNKRTWAILGATSIIAEEFAKLAAEAGQNLLLVGRNKEQLELIKADLHLRYRINSEILIIDFYKDFTKILDYFKKKRTEMDLFIAYSALVENSDLDFQKIDHLISTNVLSTVQLIHAYLNKPQNNHRLIFLSSVAACRGRFKNSLYGGTKSLVEIYLEGLQQAGSSELTITIARLGFIDTAQTFGRPGIFYASPPEACAKACWQASYKGKRLIYHPFFWRFMMFLIRHIPFFIYKKLRF